MKFTLLDKKEQCENLKKGDLIVVKWIDCWVKHTPKAKNIMFYSVVENKEDCHEIICQKKDNHFFNYKRYLAGTSGAKEVYLVEE